MRDALRVEEVGKIKKEKFTKERLTKDDDDIKGFFDWLARVKLLSMNYCNKAVTMRNSQGHVFKNKEQGYMGFGLLVMAQEFAHRNSIDELMTFNITAVPDSLGTPGGFLTKADKSKLGKHMTMDSQDVHLPCSDRSIIFLEYGNAWPNWLVDVPDTFGDTPLKLLEQLPHNVDVCFSTDMYFEHFVKSQEHLQSGEMRNCLSESSTRDVPLISGVLSNAEKRRSCSTWCSMHGRNENASRHIHDHCVYLVVDGHVHRMSSGNGSHVPCQEEHAMRANQQETDTRVIVNIKWAQDHGYRAVCVCSSDPDVFCIFLKFANAFAVTIFLDTGA